MPMHQAPNQMGYLAQNPSLFDELKLGSRGNRLSIRDKQLIALRSNEDLGKNKSEKLGEQALCSGRTVRKILSNVDRYGQVGNPFHLKPGRPSELSGLELKFLGASCICDPTVEGDELQERLEELFEHWVSLATIDRGVHNVGIRRKKLSKVASQRNEELRALWRALLKEIWLLVKEAMGEEGADWEKVCERFQALFVATDESGIDDENTSKRDGWGFMGVRAVKREFLVSGIRTNLLPALISDGILSIRFFEGGCTRETFLEFLKENVFPYCNRWDPANPQPRSILVLDNASFHHGSELRQLAEEKGIRLMFLPPYSPDYNPCEEVFAWLKRWLRKRGNEVHGVFPKDRFVRCAIAEFNDTEIAEALFDDCGYWYQ